MPIESINHSPVYQYSAYQPAGYSECNQNIQMAQNAEDGELKELSGTRLGSAKTDVAKKGLKYFFKKFKNFVIKVFKGDEQAQKHVIDIADKTHRTYTFIHDLNSDNDNRYSSIA